jgi:uncharacterized protein YbjT (DUF2867 family)
VLPEHRVAVSCAPSQGGARGGFRARAIARDTNSPKAKELAALGAEMVSGDVGDQAFYWAHSSPPREVAEAGKMAAIPKQAGVRHVIWSTLEDTRRWIPRTDNRMPTLMENLKSRISTLRAKPIICLSTAGVPTTNLLTSFYWDNFIYFGMGPKKVPDGRLAITLPMGDRKLPGIAAEDIGKCAHGIFGAGGQFIGKTVGIAGGHLTGAEMAAGFSQALGREVVYNPVPPSVYRGFGFPGADDLGNMFQFKHDFNDYFCAPAT